SAALGGWPEASEPLEVTVTDKVRWADCQWDANSERSSARSPSRRSDMMRSNADLGSSDGIRSTSSTNEKMVVVMGLRMDCSDDFFSCETEAKEAEGIGFDLMVVELLRI
ncbi:hypothetical protein, partial [Aeromonas veronii]|uniref:hypothetical protein n=1 Tax=Aeromonas veronii TaxID=654 RepID=UPI00197BAA14